MILNPHESRYQLMYNKPFLPTRARKARLVGRA